MLVLYIMSCESRSFHVRLFPIGISTLFYIHFFISLMTTEVFVGKKMNEKLILRVNLL